MQQDSARSFAEQGSSSDASSHLKLPSLPQDSTRGTNVCSHDSKIFDSLEGKGRRRKQPRPQHVVQIEEEGQGDHGTSETTDKRKREHALQVSLENLEDKLEDKFIKNAAVLPDLQTRLPRPQEQSSTLSLHRREEPLLIHGHSVSEYQRIYHSVVDGMLKTPNGEQQAYSLKLGLKIKQELWERLFCPVLTDAPRTDGHYRITESFCRAGLKRKAPKIKVDISGEPRCQPPKKKTRR